MWIPRDRIFSNVPVGLNDLFAVSSHFVPDLSLFTEWRIGRYGKSNLK